MSASDHLQRRLFYTAGELSGFLANDSLHPIMPFKEDKELFKRKLRESKVSEDFSGKWSGTLYDHIKLNGIQSPISLHDKYVKGEGTPTIMNGHHRIAAAYDINPEMFIPVEYIR